MLLGSSVRHSILVHDTRRSKTNVTQRHTSTASKYNVLSSGLDPYGGSSFTSLFIAPSSAPDRNTVVTNAVTDSESKTAGWPGAKPVPLLLCLAAGFAIRYLVPIPQGVTKEGWTMMSIFLCTIAGLVLEPLPTGATAFLGLTTTVLTKTLTFSQATAAMTSEVIWLIVVSFFFAKGFEITGLGERVALHFVKMFGKDSLGLSYGLNAAEAIITPAMPSTTARAGGIFVPVMKSISESSGSHPGDKSRLKLGAFLAHSQFQTSSHSSALFITGAAQNLLCIKLASDTIGAINYPFVTWLIGACVPAAIGFLLTPLIIYKIIPPEIKDTPEAPAEAERELKAKGPMTRDEFIMATTMSLAVILWIMGESIGVSAVLTGMIGLSILLLTGVLKWKDCLEYSPAWDTLFWFAVLISMSGALNSMGVIKAMADTCATYLTSLNMGWMQLFFLLNFGYFVVHYLFASQTAHVGALLVAFLSLMISANVPPLLAAMSLAFNSNLFGSITQFASGQAAVYYGSGLMSLSEMFTVGAICGTLNLIVWGGIGILWWKLIGWW
eukprot:g3953.t1